MIEIMKSGHPLWNKTITFAENCSWRAGAALAKRMRENAFAEDERVLVELENDEIAGFCTFANKDELLAEYASDYESKNYRVPDYPVDKCTILRAVYYTEEDERSGIETASAVDRFLSK